MLNRNGHVRRSVRELRVPDARKSPPAVAPYPSAVTSQLKAADWIHRFPAKMTARLAGIFLTEVVSQWHKSVGGLTFHDPMCGSGTTALLARYSGFAVSASDVLLPAVQIARAKLNRLGTSGLGRLVSFLEEDPISSKTSPRTEWGNAGIWFRDTVLRALEDIRDAILLERRFRHFPHLLVAHFQTIWDVSAADKKVIVPTRSRFSPEAPGLSPNEVLERFRGRLRRIIRAQEALRCLKLPTRRISVNQGNAIASGGWPRSKPDVVLTSPPYGCGLDYPRAFRLQTKIWESSGMFCDRRSEVIGRRYYLNVDEAALKDFENEFNWLRRLRRKSSNAALRLTQFLLDLVKFFGYANARMQSDGVLGIVVGDPEMGGIRIPLHTIIPRMALNAGFNLLGGKKKDAIKSRIQNFKLRSASAPIQSEFLMSFRNS